MMMIVVIIVKINIFCFRSGQEIHQETSFRFYTLICIDINLIDTTIKDNIAIMGVKVVMAQG